MVFNVEIDYSFIEENLLNLNNLNKDTVTKIVSHEVAKGSTTTQKDFRTQIKTSEVFGTKYCSESPSKVKNTSQTFMITLSTLNRTQIISMTHSENSNTTYLRNLISRAAYSA